jgi:multidrug efflux pump subunit AcrB
MEGRQSWSASRSGAFSRCEGVEEACDPPTGGRNGASGILSFESTSDSLGQVEITANFVPGTDSSMASVEVQNRIKRVEARLPRAVIQQGILIEEASSAVLQIITLR